MGHAAFVSSVFFFYKQKTAYELRISDWSSDVCSSDLAKDHKLALIRNMLELYDQFPFVLIGDSGQRDPEIYAQVVREHPGRVAAIYIRDVTRNPERDRGKIGRASCRERVCQYV